MHSNIIIISMYVQVAHQVMKKNRSLIWFKVHIDVCWRDKNHHHGNRITTGLRWKCIQMCLFQKLYTTHNHACMIVYICYYVVNKLSNIITCIGNILTFTVTIICFSVILFKTLSVYADVVKGRKFLMHSIELAIVYEHKILCLSQSTNISIYPPKLTP